MKRYSISEASNIIGYDTHVLRFYEKEFNLDIPRNSSNHRYYTDIEIEKFLYIKNLKERGLSNSQIKEILKSPEIILNANEIACTTQGDISISNMEGSELKFLKHIEMELNNSFNKISEKLIKDIEETLDNYLQKIYGQKENDDRDALISENARLKMKLKEKAYENAMLKEKLNKLENGKKSLFKRLFG